MLFMFGEVDLSYPGRSKLRTPDACESGSWQSGSLIADDTEHLERAPTVWLLHVKPHMVSPCM